MHMVESERHQQMKRAAAAVLESEGYNIVMEKRIGGARIDVFGENIDETVAVEVGQLGNERARHIENECDRLVHIPYERIESSEVKDPEGRKRANIVVRKNNWDILGGLVGTRGRSQLLRDMVQSYIEIFGEGEQHAE